MATLRTVREQAKAAISKGDYGQARALIAKILHSFPNDYETLGLLGQVHLEDNRRDDARQLFEGLLEVDPENVLARSGLAIIAEEDGDLGRALDHFTRIFEIDISNRQIAAEIRRLNSKISGPRRADPGYSKHALGRRLLHEGMYGEAITLFDAAMETDPEPVLVALGMARALWLSGRLEEAGDVADEILARHPACLKALAIRAGVAAAKRDPIESVLLEKIAAMNPGCSVAKEIYLEAGLVLPSQFLIDPDLVDEEGDLPEGGTESESGIDGEEKGEDGNEESFEIPDIEVEGEWTREKQVDDKPIACVRQADLHLEAASDYWSKGLIEPATNELRAVLRLDAALAPKVKDILIAFVEAFPDNAEVRWLLGDTLVMVGKLKLAMEQYMVALGGPSNRAYSQTEKERDGTNTGNRET